MTEVAIAIRDVHLAFPLVRFRPAGLKEAFLRRLRGSKGPAPEQEFWALRGVDLNIERGEVIGLVGRNGSGKSTLLRVITRIYAPDRGSVETMGRISSLLELGAGFREELSGDENITLNGAILGYSPEEMAQLRAGIVEFSGLGDFMQQPLRTYSSGMRARLGFAVAAAVRPDILIIDEALAVGDAEFRAKSMARIEELTRDQHTTVVIVSHNEAELRRLCTRLVLLERGQVVVSGDADTVFGRYRPAGAP